MNDGKWDLSALYSSMDDPKFEADLVKAEKMMNELDEMLSGDVALKDLVQSYESTMETLFTASTYPELTLTADASDEKALACQDRLMKLQMHLQQIGSAVTAKIGAIEDLDEQIEKDAFLKERAFFLTSMREECKHLIDPKLEPIVLRMSMTGAQAWSQLRDKLDAGHMVDVEINGEVQTMPLSAARGLAYSADPAVRKAAYEGEIASYVKMETPMAACLNGIKGESITKSELRHFDSPLDAALFASNMDKETLDALLLAMEESMPYWRKYFRLKAKALGHEGGLPFWELFAPLGGSGKTYTVEEAKDLLIRELGSFSEKMGSFIADMFEKEHIDLYPREGKAGGAFCAGVHSLKTSYILTNFEGSLSSVGTLAHELGHGYHNVCTDDIPFMAAMYPMPLAETASIFNETLFSDALKKKCTEEEKLALIDQELTDAAQVIVDIMSRYLFEKEVFSRRDDHAMTAKELCDIMLDAQKKTYGDGLDENAMHPYMWACKSHYYSSGIDFYNFPYAFGLLFGKGVFAIYQEKGKDFLPIYDELLRTTGSGTIRQVAASVGINVADPDFWRASLKVLMDEIDEMEKLVG